jgi:glycosyltransferase involved in cell wall biosynthesis
MAKTTGQSVTRVAYVMSRFPRLSETFVLFEMMAVEAHGASIELFPLIRERTEVIHPEAGPFVDRMHYELAASPRVLMSNLWWIRTDVRRYLGTLAAVVRGTYRSANFLVGGLAAFPKIAHYARRMEQLGVGHVHCHFANHPALAGFVIHRLTGIPYSFTAHGSDLHVDQTMLADKVREASFVVTISEYNRRMIVETCGSESRTDHVHVVHCGVDTGVFVPRPAVGPGDGPLRIVCIGTLHEVKGQRYLLEACAELHRRGVALHCVLVGDGPDRPKLEALREELGLAGSVELVGRRTREQIAEHIADADVLVAPSVPTNRGKREGIPVVLMEAMSAGLPVVASRLSGIPELVEHEVSGLLVEPFDPAQIADALDRIAGDVELRCRFGARARERVLAEFDVMSNAHALLELIYSTSRRGRDSEA